MRNHPNFDRLTKWIIPMSICWSLFFIHVVATLLFSVPAYGIIFFAALGLIGLIKDLSERFGN